MDDQTRNLNPTAEAVVAMNLFGQSYARDGRGSMDFWDSLDARHKKWCRQIVEEVREADRRHKPDLSAEREIISNVMIPPAHDDRLDRGNQ